MIEYIAFTTEAFFVDFNADSLFFVLIFLVSIDLSIFPISTYSSYEGTVTLSLLIAACAIFG